MSNINMIAVEGRTERIIEAEKTRRCMPKLTANIALAPNTLRIMGF